MRLESISFESYKPFAEPFVLELRPLTIFLGRNGAGKSALVRLPALILEALAYKDGPGLPFEAYGFHYGNSITDLIHDKQSHGKLSLGFVFSHEQAEWRFQATIQALYNPEEDRVRQIVSHLRSEITGQEPVVLEWLPRDSRREGVNIYRTKIGAKEWTGPIEFQGLMPVHSDIKVIDRIWAGLLSEYRKQFVPIGPLRQMAPRYLPRLDRMPDKVAVDGANAAQILEKGEETLLRKVNQWFSRVEIGERRIDIQATGALFEVYLKRSDIAVHLYEAGQGMGQVFPIVVQRCIPVIAPRLEVIEEPESHLHPSAHADVAELFCAGLHDAPNLQMLVETHSEVFLLRVRRAVAEGRINPEDVIFYWVDDEDETSSQVQPIEIDRRGDVGNWPSDVFSEDYHEARAIRQAASKLAL